ncbi:MAG: inositol monophosphatase family protein [Anaerolineaceae bacterium]
MVELNLEAELAVAVAAGRAAGAEVLRLRIEGVRYGRKEGWELVSEADILAAEMLHEALTKPFPDTGWLSEEHTDTAHRLDKERVWVVDPIDGTREYLQGIPEYAISIGLVINGAPALGVVYNPATDRLSAASCLGTDERPPRKVLPTKFQALVGRGEHRTNDIPPLPRGAKSRGIGSVAYRLALLSEGEGDVCVTGTGRSEWDVAAGAALCLAAGLRVTGVLGEPLAFNQPDPYIRGLLVAEPALHEHISRFFDQFRS